MIGNFLGDFVKKGREDLFDEDIRKGIILHRKIDSFSDKTQIVKKSKKRFPEHLYRFSGIAVDIIYDHFLAKNFSTIAFTDLKDFLNSFYSALEPNELPLKEEEKRLIRRIINENWMYRYKDKEYTKNTIYRVSKRIKRQNPLDECCFWFEKYYREFEKDFFKFLPVIEEFVIHQRKELL